MPVVVLDHDFPIKELGKATPYGIYDIMKNVGFVNTGISSDTADSGGSNGVRVKLWKPKLRELSNEFGKILKVSHFQPGTSKWNKIEHRLFSFISQNWLGKSLISLAVLVSLSGAATTEIGLRVTWVIDYNEYKKGIDVSDEKLRKVNSQKDDVHGAWNYAIVQDSCIEK